MDAESYYKICGRLDWLEQLTKEQEARIKELERWQYEQDTKDGKEDQ